MTILWFLFKEGFKGLLRSKYSGAFSIIIIAISIIMVGFGYIIARDTLFMVENIRSQFDVDIFILTTAGSDDIAVFDKKLRRMNEIDRVIYISPEIAAEKFKKEFGEDILDILDYNPLPPSFTISLKPIYRNLMSVEAIANILQRDSVVDEVKYRKNFLIILEKYQRIILVCVLIVFAFLTLISIILTSNSIKMTIFARRDIILTMKLIGATNRFVKTPFVIEGTLEGGLGALLAGLIIYGIIYVQNTYLQSFFNYTLIVSYQYYIGLLLLGSFLGWIGSRQAIRRFL
ncbi:permease-like cell division protein FtsX [bacterium]|nr:permease-like cell division protein FtsX [bacterium]MBU1066104.1 permease-like cell division protein FtsX [bacterium]MBU1633977.1 permease-like cell division protein FtsX [bacterium]MBU1875171.1 permease-like cell division protein FtsX [bacterium]